MVVGDPSVLAIESSITKTYPELSQLALGFFIIHVGGKSYGVRTPDASLLACSFDEVERRIAQRGKHVVAFGSEPDAAKVVDAVRVAMYDEDREHETFFGLSADEVQDALYSQHRMGSRWR